MLLTLLAFAVALGVLVTFHELGHYWAARRCGVRVERFSVGFGKVLLKRTDRNGTQWALSAIPLGGYVKMLDDPPAHVDAVLAASAFNRKSLAQRSFIVAAGPAANLLLAVALYAALGMMGTSEPAAVLAQPPAQTAAAQAGIGQGDRVLRVGTADVRSWNELRWHLLDVLSAGGSVALQVETQAGVRQERWLDLNAVAIAPDAPDPMAQAGLALAVPPPRIQQVMAGEAAEQAGLRAGDVILRAGDLQQPTAGKFVAFIQQNGEQPVPLTVQRGEVPLQFTLVPRRQADQPEAPARIGVMLTTDFPMVDVRYGIFESLQRGFSRTVDTVWFSLRMMGRMITGDVSLKNISGPVTIADYAGQTARVGLASYIGFLALISVSIGVLNLLPIPMLDGGHLMYYLAEGIRGKPLPDVWLERGQRIGAGLLAALMALAFFNDFTRLFS